MTVFSLLLAAKRDGGRDQHRKLMTDDEAEISVNGNRGRQSTTFNCILYIYIYIWFCHRKASGECSFIIFQPHGTNERPGLNNFFPLALQLQFGPWLTSMKLSVSLPFTRS
jgi:hypothetical protein